MLIEQDYTQSWPGISSTARCFWTYGTIRSWLKSPCNYSPSLQYFYHLFVSTSIWCNRFTVKCILSCNVSHPLNHWRFWLTLQAPDLTSRPPFLCPHPGTRAWRAPWHTWQHHLPCTARSTLPISASWSRRLGDRCYSAPVLAGCCHPTPSGSHNLLIIDKYLLQILVSTD